MKYTVAELIDLPQLQCLMETLYRATGINHALIDNDSVIHTAVGWQEICTHYHRVHPRTCERCLESDRYILDHLGSGPYVGYQCPQGLVDYATPVIIEGEHVANIFTGQMLHEPPDIEFFRRQAREFGFDEAAYLAALAKVPIIPRERIENVMAFQVQLAQLLASQGLTRHRELETEAELRAVNEGLEQRTRELEAANRELEEFSYSVSHDLRTPLRAIAGFAQILQAEYGERLDDEGRRLLTVVRDNTFRMGELIDAILGFLRIGRQPLVPEWIDMAAMVAEVSAALVAANPGRRFSLRAAALPSAWGDPGLMRQVWDHLLGNAVKFSQDRDEAVIEVAAQSDGQQTTYYVKDNGAGFDMQYQAKLFQVFERLHSPGEFPGKGVGLATVRRIIGRHGGRVGAEGRTGEGATVFFTLPVKEK